MFHLFIYVFSLISVGLNYLIQIDGDFRCNSNAYILNLGQNIFLAYTNGGLSEIDHYSNWLVWKQFNNGAAVCLRLYRELNKK